MYQIVSTPTELYTVDKNGGGLTFKLNRVKRWVLNFYLDKFSFSNHSLTSETSFCLPNDVLTVTFDEFS